MAESKRLAVAVLAAGASRRFGTKDKLAAEFRGRMLGLHATHAIPRETFEHAWVIASDVDHPCADGWRSAGFELQANPRAAEGMGTSVALAAKLAKEAETDGLLIALADMPLVPARHFAALVQYALAKGPGHLAVSSKSGVRTPPAIFGSDRFDRLERLGGDAGARHILAEGKTISCPPEWLIDIDTPEALAANQ